jgi:hypothetical protein
MSALQRFEQLMEQVVEGSLARLFANPIQPVDIARRLERAMESRQSIGTRHVAVPHLYRVFLHPQDFAAFAALRDQLELDLAIYLRDLAEERHFTLLDAPSVTLAADPAVARRAIQVTAEAAEISAGSSQTDALRTPAQPERRAERAHLRLTGADGPLTVPIDATTFVIGRGLDNDLVLDDQRVSRQHAELRYRRRRFVLTDLNSTNGTSVNGRRITSKELTDGDRISLGGFELTFHEVGHV